MVDIVLWERGRGEKGQRGEGAEGQGRSSYEFSSFWTLIK
jgi:hypothetical protein